MVSKSVFVACVTLALILGLYMGSLLPTLLAPSVAPPKTAMRNQTQTPAPAREPVLVVPPPGKETTLQETTSVAPAAPAAKPEIEPAPSLTPEQSAQLTRLERAVADGAADAKAWTRLGNMYFDTGQPRKAIAAYGQALKLDPDNADVLTDLGIMYREAGQFEKAVASFRRASSVQPRHENALFNEGVVLYFDLQRPDDAMKAWQRLLAVNPAARAPDGQMVSDILKNLR